MKLDELLPSDDPKYGAERMFICGQSGTGKSTLTEKICFAIPSAKDEKGELHKPCVVVIDSKHDWKFRRLPWQSGAKWLALPTTDLRILPPGYYVYRPKEYPESADTGARRIFRTALKRKYCTVVIDEGADFGGAQGVPELSKLIRQARSKHVRVIFGTQRPVAVTLLAITEAIKIVCFGLGSKDDYKRLAQWGNEAFQDPPAGEHDFNFFNRRTKQFTRVKQ